MNALILPFDVSMSAAGKIVGLRAATPFVLLGASCGSRIATGSQKNLGWTIRKYADADSPDTQVLAEGTDILAKLREARPHPAWAFTAASAITWASAKPTATNFTDANAIELPKFGLPDVAGPNYAPIPEGRVWFATGEVLVVFLDDAPAAATDLNGFVQILSLPT